MHWEHHEAYQASSKHQQACCYHEMQTKGSKQRLVFDDINYPLHSQLLAVEEPL